MTTSARGARSGKDDRDGAAGQGQYPRGPTRLLTAGALAALAAAGTGLAIVTILVVVGWIAAPHLGLSLLGVLRVAAAIWLVGHHVAMQVSGAGRIGMLPLGLVALPGFLLWRAGRWVVASRRITDLREALTAAVAIAVPYALLAGGIAAASRSALVEPSIPQAVVGGFLIPMVAAGLGAIRAAAPWPQLGAQLAPRTRAVGVGVTGTLGALATVGALFVAVALASHEHQFSAVTGLLSPGPVGAGLLLLAEVAYLPNAILWAIAYTIGPGFAVGVSTIVSPSGSTIGPLPAFPLLAALPHEQHGPSPHWLGLILLAAPYLAGLVGGLLVARVAPTAELEGAAMRGLVGGGLAGLVLGGLTAFAGGPLGSNRMAVVGPSAWQIGIVAAMQLGVAAAVAAGVANWWRIRARWAADGGVGVGAAAAGPVRPSRAPAGSARTAGQPARTSPDPAAADDSGHVIYLDRWAADKAASPSRRRGHGPADLP